MFKKINLLILFVGLSTVLAAQTRKERKQEIEAQKRAYITDKLELSVEEAEKFWPLYNEFQAQRRQLRSERRKLKPGKSFDELTDSEVEKLIANDLKIKQRELDLERAYIDKFKAVLPVKKVARIRFVEEQFKKYLLEELRKTRQKGRYDRNR